MDIYLPYLSTNERLACYTMLKRLKGFTHYTTRMLRNSAMPGSLTPKHKNKYGILVMMIIIIIHCATRLELGEEKSGRHRDFGDHQRLRPGDRFGMLTKLLLGLCAVSATRLGLTIGGRRCNARLVRPAPTLSHLAHNLDLAPSQILCR